MPDTGIAPLLNVRNLSDALDFYCATLGFDLLSSFDEDGVPIWATVGFGSARLMLNQPDHGAGIDADARRSRPSYHDVVLYIYVDDVRSVRSRFEAAGVAVGPLSDEDYGLTEFLVRDREGYELAFAQVRA